MELIFIAIIEILTQIILAIINSQIGNWLINTGNAVSSGMFDGLSANVVNTVEFATNVFKNTAYGIIAILFFMELIDKATDVREMSFEKIVKMLFKLIISKMLVDYSMLTMKLIEAIFINIFSVADITRLANVSTNDLIATGAKMVPLLKLLYAVFIIVAMIEVGVILYLRRLEMMLMVMISPIAFAMLSTDGYKSTGKRFIQSFIAICLQGIILLITCNLFFLTLSSVTDGFTACFSSIGLCIIAAKSSGVAKGLVS